MYGALAGDIIGSRFEFRNLKSKNFELFTKYNSYTDDSVMTIAVAKALHESKKNEYRDLEKQLVFWMHEIGKKYPNCGYGGHFYLWIMNDGRRPYNSFGNGAGMRTSWCAWAASSLEEALELAKRCAAVTHDHPEGIRGAQAITAAAYLAREGKDKEEIRKHISDHFYPLDFSLDEIRDDYRFDVTCQGSCPQAIEAFLESSDFEDAIRNAVSIGGDSDTIAAMCGGIAEAYYGISDKMKEAVESYLDTYLLQLVREITEQNV